MAYESYFSSRSLTKMFLGSLNWILVMVIILFIPFLRPWWWIVLPLLLAAQLRKLYMWWIQWDYAYAGKKWSLLEVVPAKENLVPLKAMEDIFTVMWAVCWDSPSYREAVCEGTLTYAPGWMSWEIVSIEGKLHFYIRIPSSSKGSLETALYSHYPELEIAEVPDYVNDVPQDIPNKEWDMYAEDFMLVKDSVYPIRTYEKFFEPQGEKISAEEKRIDPLSSLLELMSRLGPGEQFWLQYITSPVSKDDEPEFFNKAKSEITKLTNRPVKKKVTPMQEVQNMLYNLVMGPKKEGSGDKASYKWMTSEKGGDEDNSKELLLSPGEREVLTEVENKVKRPVFRTTIRGCYVAKRDSFKGANKALTRAYFSHFTTQNMNSIKPTNKPKSKNFFRKLVPVAKNRKAFRNYVLRFPSMFPERRLFNSIYNTEELATLYHFPLKITGLVAPTMTRVESKRGGPPPNLPTE